VVISTEKIQRAPETEIIPGVTWGCPEAIFTPAYWHCQYWNHNAAPQQRSHRLGTSLSEEVVACLLGGHGIPAEVGLAAFSRLRDRHLTSGNVQAHEIAESLREPLSIGNKKITYRFWDRKSRYIATAIQRLEEQPPPDSAIQLRNYLLDFSGIGPKTASWIVRNWTSSNDVAILDIHVVRAGVLMGLYAPSDDVTKQYFGMEQRFLQLSRAMVIPTSDLDSLVWAYMRATPRIVARMLRLVSSDSLSDVRSRQVLWQRA
jgi:thermostable 8-oxoguanine DNA glycosylase